ncbi:DUF1506 family protein [Borrelia turicatae]|uniref:DUF1506 family protein n=1 Tax=Borrelia turicatae TaxID=142 RepID=UPI001FF29595|nr:DUF1506 family protein [Borrelia turicatae]UPA13757.1 DUF1506 family protein [Borrelia turicatae 91E135]UPA13801.1 DUF1506 family protein [Borrelia turicatae 91E135]UPA13856.1 DUF1506 family protein [Borrelia turicatae 91E135]UPA13899.1 DUF1506 family protein [Borrelia turicatae 91E135]
MSSIRDRLSKLASRAISYYRNEETLKLYKGTYAYLEDLASHDVTFNKNNFSEFTGVLFSIKADTLANMPNINLYDIKSLHKLYTTSNLDFELKDRISAKSTFYEILSIDSSIGYLTIILKEVEWK